MCLIENISNIIFVTSYRLNIKRLKFSRANNVVSINSIIIFLPTINIVTLIFVNTIIKSNFRLILIINSNEFKISKILKC